MFENNKIQTRLPPIWMVLFVITAWILLFNLEALGNPDFYEYHSASEKIFSGNLKIGVIPPLYPLLLGLSGRILSIIINTADAFILAARLISLLSALGVVIFTYYLSRKLLQAFAVPVVIFICCSPFYLKFIVSTSTDMFFLFLVILSFYLFYINSHKKTALAVVLLGVLTRFEGIILLFSFFINYFKRGILRTGKKTVFWAFALIIGSGVLYVIFFSRIVEKIKFILENQTFLNIFKYPLKFMQLVYGNVFHFVPRNFPSVLKWMLLILLLVLFTFGVRYMWRMNKRFSISVVFYLTVFLFSKGYIVSQRSLAYFKPDLQVRRMLPFVFLFILVALIGLGYLIEILKKCPLSLKTGIAIAGLSFLIYSAVHLTRINPLYGLFLIFLAPLWLLFFGHFSFPKGMTVTLIIVFSLLFNLILFKSIVKSVRYLKAEPNKAGYAIAQWINLTDDYTGINLYVYSKETMVRYYLKESLKSLKFRRFYSRKIKAGNISKLAEVVWKRLRKHQQNYIIFDSYLNYIDRPQDILLNRMFHQQRKSSDYYEVEKTLTYKGRYVATILKARN